MLQLLPMSSPESKLSLEERIENRRTQIARMQIDLMKDLNAIDVVNPFFDPETARLKTILWNFTTLQTTVSDLDDKPYIHSPQEFDITRALDSYIVPTEEGKPILEAMLHGIGGLKGAAAEFLVRIAPSLINTDLPFGEVQNTPNTQIIHLKAGF